MSPCLEKVSHSKIKIEEMKRKAIFLNPNKVDYIKGKIDGCLVDDGIRADYFISGEGKSVLVELKGCNIAHGCEQLFSAAEHKKVRPYLTGKLGFLMICSRFPSHDTSVQLAMSKAKRKYGAKFLVLTKEREVDMSMF